MSLSSLRNAVAILAALFALSAWARQPQSPQFYCVQGELEALVDPINRKLAPNDRWAVTSEHTENVTVKVRNSFSGDPMDEVRQVQELEYNTPARMRAGKPVVQIRRTKGPHVYNVRGWDLAQTDRKADPTFWFSATDDWVDQGIVSFNIKTRNAASDRSGVLIQAQKEFNYALDYFGRDRIRGIHASWEIDKDGVPSDNLIQLNAALAEKKPPYSPEDFEKAAKQSWTGRQAAAAGFTECHYRPFTSRSDRDGKVTEIEFIFTRPR